MSLPIILQAISQITSNRDVPDKLVTVCSKATALRACQFKKICVHSRNLSRCYQTLYT